MIAAFVQAKEGNASASGILAYEILFDSILGLPNELQVEILQWVTPSDVFQLECLFPTILQLVKNYGKSIHEPMWPRLQHIDALYSFNFLAQYTQHDVRFGRLSTQRRMLYAKDQLDWAALHATGRSTLLLWPATGPKRPPSCLYDAVLVLMMPLRQWPVHNIGPDLTAVSRFTLQRRNDLRSCLSAILRAATDPVQFRLPNDMPYRYQQEMGSKRIITWLLAPNMLERLKRLFDDYVPDPTNRFAPASFGYMKMQTEFRYNSQTGERWLAAAEPSMNVQFAGQRDNGTIRLRFHHTAAQNKTATARVWLKLLEVLKAGEQFNEAIYEGGVCPHIYSSGYTVARRRATWRWWLWPDEEELGLERLFQIIPQFPLTRQGMRQIISHYIPARLPGVPGDTELETATRVTFCQLRRCIWDIWALQEEQRREEVLSRTRMIFVLKEIAWMLAKQAGISEEGFRRLGV